MKMRSGSKKIKLIISSILIVAAFAAFALTAYAEEYYDSGRGTFPVLRLIVCFAIGLFISFLITSGMRAQLRSVESRNNASFYIKPSSFAVTDEKDVFLDKTTERTLRYNPDRDDQSGRPGDPQVIRPVSQQSSRPSNTYTAQPGTRPEYRPGGQQIIQHGKQHGEK